MQKAKTKLYRMHTSVINEEGNEVHAYLMPIMYNLQKERDRDEERKIADLFTKETRA